jgi:hypothetical protein
MRRRLVALALLLGSTPASAANPHDQAALSGALAAAATGDGEAANAALARLSDDRDARLALGLDLVEAWWRVSHSERAINTLSKWRQEAPRSPEPVVRARARALTGSPFDVDAALGTFTEAGVLCALMPVAQSLDAVGQRDAGQRLLDKAWEQGACPDAATQRATWESPPDAHGSPPPVVAPAPARQFALGPGHEPRFIRVLPDKRGELPQGMGLMHLTVLEDRAEAYYGAAGGYAASCAEAPLCVTLWHRSVAQAGDQIAGHFALRVLGEDVQAARALVDGISGRLRAEGDWDPWLDTTPAPPQPPVSTSEPSEPPLAPSRPRSPRTFFWFVGAALVGLAFIWIWRRRSRPPA